MLNLPALYLNYEKLSSVPIAQYLFPRFPKVGGSKGLFEFAPFDEAGDLDYKGVQFLPELFILCLFGHSSSYRSPAQSAPHFSGEVNAPTKAHLTHLAICDKMGT